MAGWIIVVIGGPALHDTGRWVEGQHLILEGPFVGLVTAVEPVPNDGVTPLPGFIEEPGAVNAVLDKKKPPISSGSLLVQALMWPWIHRSISCLSLSVTSCEESI